MTEALNTEESPNLSIIVPLYNCADYIEETLHSVLACFQTEQIEVIVVDDGSTDDGPARVEKMLQQNPCIQLVKNGAGKGVSAARNFGMQRASGQYIGFLDADDVLFGPESQRKLDYAVTHAVEVITSDFVRFEDGETLTAAHANFANNPDYQRYFSSEGPCETIKDPIAVFLDTGCLIWTGCVFIRRALIEQEQLQFNTALANSEDDDFWYRACFGRTLHFYKAVTTGYRMRAVSASSAPLKKFRGMLYFRRLLLNDAQFADYRPAISKKYQRDFSKFALVCAQQRAFSTFYSELSLLLHQPTMSGSFVFGFKESARFVARVVKTSRAGARI
ncbi:glycosyltransferase family 2 protein [Alteromonas oceanisediminis]|uniref:glycosyltransferase family 2 protein n=1 Tax=Alteromonas oceanisediminis TaxID=2836180 RepID=UPI001BD9703C|nr:glycosyltransferase family A protein [Alteromonas oceanisediminis]MBT0585680.1 glycosyltransferase family 2 protein [Alteromonas oceanisediminis]